MSSHHVTLETAQRLKAAGFPQTTREFWSGPNRAVTEWHVSQYKGVTDDWCAAPILTEVLEQLPVNNGGDKLTITKQHILKGGPESYSVGYGSIRPFAIRIGNPNPAEAAALLWLKLKEADEPTA